VVVCRRNNQPPEQSAGGLFLTRYSPRVSKS
jgi:hypothetical protein